MAGGSNPFELLLTLTPDDIPDICGPIYAAQGRRLAESNAVHDTSILRDGLTAYVEDEKVSYEVEICVEPDGEVWGLCDCLIGEDCAHVAAVLYTWLQSPQLFMPRSVGDFLDLLAEGSPLRDLLTATDPRTEKLLGKFDSLPEELKSALAELPVEALEERPPGTALWSGLHAEEATIQARLRELLETYKVRELRAIGRRRGFRLKGVTKAEIVEQLIELLRDSARQPDLLEDLTRQEFEALRLLNTVYGIRDYVTWDEAQYAWMQHHAKGGTTALRKVLEGLFEYGLLFPCRLHGNVDQHYHWLPYLSTLRLPVLKPVIKTYPQRRLRSLSRPATTPPLPTAMWLLAAFTEREALRLSPPRARHPQSHLYPWLNRWIHDPEEANRLIQQGYAYRYTYTDAAITIPSLGSLTAEEVLDRLALWLGSDREFADWLVMMAAALQLLNLPKDKDLKIPLTLNREQWGVWVAQGPDTQLRVLFETWRQGLVGLIELRLVQLRYPELRLERSLRYPDFEPEDLVTELSEARGFIARLLQEVPANTWLDWNRFAEWARQVDPEFLHSYWSVEAWGFTVREGKRLDPTRRGHWERAYRPVLAAFLEGPLRWLGAVEVAHKGRNLSAFRLTQTGAWLLRNEGRPAIPAPGRPGEPLVAWLDERTLRLQPVPEIADLLGIVVRFAAPTNRPYTYRLSENSIEQAFARGVAPAEIAEAFQKAGAPLPEATREQLEDLWSRFGHVHLYEKLTVLELADDLALREVLANTRLEQHIIHEFSPRLVVIEDSAVDQLVEQLVKKGYTPKSVT